MIKRACSLAFILVLSCGRVHDAPTGTRMSRSVNGDHACASRDQLIDLIGQAVISGDSEGLRAFTATADDLLLLQGGLKRTSANENRSALTRQMADDVVTAINRFRARTKPSRVARTSAGEFREQGPIENVAPAVDQVRNTQIVFDTSAGERQLMIGMLVRVDRCWKILYI